MIRSSFLASFTLHISPNPLISGVFYPSPLRENPLERKYRDGLQGVAGKSRVLVILTSSLYPETSLPGIPGSSPRSYGPPGLPSGKTFYHKTHIDIYCLQC